MGNAGPGAFFGGVLTTVVGSFVTVASGGILTPAYVGGLMLTGAAAGCINSALDIDVTNGNGLGTSISGGGGSSKTSITITGERPDKFVTSAVNAILPSITLCPKTFDNIPPNINLSNIIIKKVLTYKRLFNMADAQLASSLLAQENVHVTPSTIMEKYRNVEYYFVVVSLQNDCYLIVYKHHMGVTKGYYSTLDQALNAIGNPGMTLPVSNWNLAMSAQQLFARADSCFQPYIDTHNSQSFAIDIFNGIY